MWLKIINIIWIFASILYKLVEWSTRSSKKIEMETKKEKDEVQKISDPDMASANSSKLNESGKGL
jgi:hypothetical protein